MVYTPIRKSHTQEKAAHTIQIIQPFISVREKERKSCKTTKYLVKQTCTRWPYHYLSSPLPAQIRENMMTGMPENGRTLSFFSTIFVETIITYTQRGK